MDYHVVTLTNILLRFIEALAHTLFAAILLNKNIPLKKSIVFAIGLGIIYELVHIFSPHYLSGVVAVCIFVPALKILLKEKWTNIIYAYLITALTIGVVDCIVSFILVAIFELNTFQEAVNNQTIYIIGSLTISLITFTIAGYIYYSKLIKNNIEEMQDIKKLGVLINYIVMFTLLVPNILTLIYYHDKRPLPFEFTIINICSIIILFFVNMYNTNNNIKLAKAEQELLEKEAQQNLIDGLRTFKHDYSNTLQTMNSCLQYNKIDKLKEIFQQVMDETKVITTLDNLNPNKIKDPAIFGILNGKYKKAKENKLKMEVTVFGDTDKMAIDTFDLTRMLGILLDNAIEAAKTSKKKKITFSITERKDDVMFEITNTFSDKNIDIDKIKQKGVSSKGKNRGLGLYKVEEIIKKYDTVENITQIEADTFVQVLIISKGKIFY